MAQATPPTGAHLLLSSPPSECRPVLRLLRRKMMQRMTGYVSKDCNSPLLALSLPPVGSRASVKPVPRPGLKGLGEVCGQRSTLLPTSK